MHNSTEYGFLIVNGQILDKKRIHFGLNLSPKRFQKAFRELIDFKVIKQDDRGAYYSKRMIEDERVRLLRAKGGYLGGNPQLVGHKVNLEDNLPSNLKPTPSSSSSSSYKEIDKEKTEYAPGVYLTDKEQKTFVDRYGQDGLNWIAEKLSAYKEASGKSYKSDAAAIRSWVVGEYRKQGGATVFVPGKPQMHGFVQ